jgi:hypothetical protein
MEFQGRQMVIGCFAATAINIGTEPMKPFFALGAGAPSSHPWMQSSKAAIIRCSLEKSILAMRHTKMSIKGF